MTPPPSWNGVPLDTPFALLNGRHLRADKSRAASGKRQSPPPSPGLGNSWVWTGYTKG